MADGHLVGRDIKAYVLGGKATFTVSFPDGTRYTYRVIHRKEHLYYLYCLFGSDNTTDYRYIGYYYDDSGYYGIDKRYSYVPRGVWPRPIRTLSYILDNLDTPDTLPASMIIQHCGRCARCGRLLTTPESITTGLGPHCRRYADET